MMIYWVLLPVLAVALECPSVVCSSTPASQCFQPSPDALLISPCTNSTSTCPSFPLLPPAPVNCVPKKSHNPPRKCLKYYEEKQQCDLNRPCQAGLYCHSPDGVCARKALVGNICNDLWECEEGSVCNKGYCVPYFSLQAGESSDSRIACESGIVSRGICAQEAKSLRRLPVSCEKDDDCRASDGSFGTCRCAYSASPTGYCSIHPSDYLVKDFLVALHDNHVEKATYLQKRILTYPRSEFAESCVKAGEKELRTLSMLKDWSTNCWAAALLLTPLFLV